MKIKDILSHPDGYFVALAEMHIKQAEEESRLYEGLILSHPASSVAASVGNLLKGKGKIYHSHDNPHAIDITMSSPVDGEIIRKAIQRFQAGGWHLAQTNVFSRGWGSPKGPENFKDDIEAALNRLRELDDNIKIQMIFEAKYGTNVTEDIISKHEYLYHATPSTKTEKILKKGLSPKTESKIAVHPDRIYMATTEDGAYKFSLMINGQRRVNKIPTLKFTILKINTKAFDRPGVRLYTDPAFSGGVFTNSNIHPSYISVVNEVISP